jgi:ferredoxin-thioredoxin reductase catalytic subunit
MNEMKEFNVAEDLEQFEVSDDLMKNLKVFAEKNNYTFTKDAPKIIKSLKAIKKAHGKYYCPCRVKTEGSQCPCEFSHEDIKKTGHCHCNLFEKKK